MISLYQIPWRRIYTTNYDNAIELAREGRQAISSATIEDPVSKAVPGSIVHLNGYIKYVSPASMADRLVLTDHSYAVSRLIESEWFKFFLRDIRSARSVIFVGYSLSDLDIQRALISEPSISRKTFFFISPSADELEIGAVESYGKLVPGGVDALVSTIKSVSVDYDIARAPSALMALTEVLPSSEVNDAATNVQKLMEQLVFSRLPEREVLLGEFVFSKQLFLVLRRQDRDAIEAMRRGPWRDFLYIGELASGKTAGALNLASHLISEGYRVFYAKKSVFLSDELHKIARRQEKIAIVFENYYLMTDEIRDYVARRHSSHRVILTERTVTHELTSDYVYKMPHLGPIFEANFDLIDKSDIAQFESLVNFCGFWGDRAGAGELARQTIIAKQLDSSLYKLLVEIIKSEKVQLEIKNLMEPLRADQRAMKLFVSSFIVNVLGFQFSINDWQAVFDGQWVRQIMRVYRDQVRHFLTISGDTIFPRAGVLSAHILRTFADDDVVRESLVDLYERSIRGEMDDPEFLSLRIALTRYGSIEPIFSESKKGTNIFRYYDEIRVFGGTRNNPDYWLQVGIAATIHEDLPRAEDAFKNAYSRERAKKSPNLKKIDNYFSRFEMRKAIDEEDPHEAFVTFLQAAERLKKQIFLEVNRHYPFKTGRYYTDIAAKHFSKWSADQQNKFITETTDIRQRAYDWRSSSREVSPDVEILIRETSRLLEKLAKPSVAD